MYVKLCNKKILPPNELRSFKLMGHEILVVILNDTIYCLAGRCTHAGSPLAEGNLQGEVLTCPWHYSQFNIKDGSVLRGPAYKPLKTYLVKEKESIVYVDL
jgi:3-phenylpropionate/trans-cinnamate dioxygenase ferredoxin component